MDEIFAKVPILMLIASRIGGVVVASPVFNNRFLPAQSRVAFSFLLALILMPATQVDPAVLNGSALLASCVLELLVGLVIGFLSLLIFAAVQTAGGLLDLDMGFTMAQIFDPVSGRSEAIMGTFYSMLALLIYFGLNAHHELIRALADSFQTIPVGGLSLTSAGPMAVALFFGGLLNAAVKMVLPFMGAMMLASIAVAAMNRAMPQMNVFSVGLGAKTLVGFILLGLLLPYLPSFLETLFIRGHAELLQILDLFH